MTGQSHDKNFLRTIKDNSEAIPHGYSAIDLLPELMAGLGSPVNTPEEEEVQELVEAVFSKITYRIGESRVEGAGARVAL